MQYIPTKLSTCEFNCISSETILLYVIKHYSHLTQKNNISKLSSGVLFPGTPKPLLDNRLLIFLSWVLVLKFKCSWTVVAFTQIKTISLSSSHVGILHMQYMPTKLSSCEFNCISSETILHYVIKHYSHLIQNNISFRHNKISFSRHI